MAFVTPVVEHWLEREIAQCVHPMKDRSDDPSCHERMLLPGSYISLPTYKEGNILFNSLVKHISVTIEWCLTYGLFFSFSSKISFICIIPQQDSTYHSLCYTVVEHQVMVQWAVGSIPSAGLIELFFIPATAP